MSCIVVSFSSISDRYITYNPSIFFSFPLVILIPEREYSQKEKNESRQTRMKKVETQDGSWIRVETDISQYVPSPVFLFFFLCPSFLILHTYPIYLHKSTIEYIRSGWNTNKKRKPDGKKNCVRSFTVFEHWWCPNYIV